MTASEGHLIARLQIAKHGVDRYPTALRQLAKIIDEASELLGAMADHYEHGFDCDPATCPEIRSEYADLGLSYFALGDKLGTGIDAITAMRELVDADTRSFRDG